MADYGLKYYAEFKNTRGQDYRLEVYQRDYTGLARVMANLCACMLEVQGNMGDIISPVIKTQLRFSLVDAWDMGETGTHKYGNWQEFFTPDSTLYKVVLKDGEGATIWTGYVTPDSWLEDLDYRGTVTITARDNIGHMQDFPFQAVNYAAADSNGLVEIRWLLQQAVLTVDFPMQCVVESPYSGQYVEVPLNEDDKSPIEGLVNASLFEGMNWYEVFEKTLEAIGYAFRYVGNNKCVIACLRNLPRLGHYNIPTVETQEMEFYGGTLELDPAVKKIEEEQDYKMEKEVEFPVFDGLRFSNTPGTYRCKTDGNPLPGGGTVNVPEHDAIYYELTNSGKTGWDTGSGMFNPDAKEADGFLEREEGADGWKKYAFIACNQQPGAGGTSIVADFRFKTHTSGMKLTFRFTPNAVTIRNYGTMSGKVQKPRYTLANVKYYAMLTDGTNTRYWNGAGWVSSPYLVSKDYDSANLEETDVVIETNECQDIPDGGEIVIRFGQITYKMFYDGGYGCYARVASITAEVKAQTVLQSNKVTTVNNEIYNVMLTRRPLFGFLSRKMGFITPANYEAGVFYYPSYGSAPELMNYVFGMTDTLVRVPFPVLVHQQILCYYYGAARVLSGNCAPVGKVPFDFGKLCTYKGFTYLLQGGTLDLFSGTMTGAVLREFVLFEDLWDEVQPEYSEEVIYNN